MAIIKLSDIKKMTKSEIESKLKDLKLELVKGSVTANKANAKTKEIKRTIARLFTFGKNRKEEQAKK